MEKTILMFILIAIIFCLIIQSSIEKSRLLDMVTRQCSTVGPDLSNDPYIHKIPLKDLK